MTTAYPLPVQAQTMALAGSGAVIGDTSIILKSFRSIDGVQLTMTDFNNKGFLTLEPGNNTQEEQISFTGANLNSNGTTTLTGVMNVSMTQPYTETSGLKKTHAGSSTVVISNTSGFYNAMKGYVDGISVSGGVPATTSVQGIAYLPTIITGTTATLSMTTNSSQQVIVWAKGVYDPGGTSGYNDTVYLKYNGTTKDQNNIAGTGSGGTIRANQPFALMYTETPGAGTHDITIVAGNQSAISNVVIIALIIGS